MAATWSFCASLQQLEGIHDAQEWMAWAELAGYQPPSLEAMVWIVKASKGIPDRIVEVIQANFPHRHNTIKPKESVYAQRKRFRENMIAAFSLEELKDICSDMEIEYENLPNHGQLNSFVRELIAFAGRIGRLNELIEICQTERPHLEW